LGQAIVLSTGPVHAQPKEPAAPPPADVDKAVSVYTKLDYDKANDVATRVLKKNNLTHDQMVRATKV
jgi:hypothetical protein